MKTPFPRMMKGVLLTGHGGFEKLEARNDIPVPELREHEVLVQVGAAGINNTDINTRLAWYSKQDGDSSDASWTGEPLKLPLIQGADVCGRIVAVGAQVSASRLGERVLIEPCLKEVNGRFPSRPHYLGSECNGGFAEFTAVASRHAHVIESSLSDVELASFPCAYSTAENMLHRAGVQAGERVLVTGASGGVGSAAVQLAVARGATVVAVTGAAKADAVRALGVTQTIDRHESPLAAFGHNQFDVVVVLVAGQWFPDYLNVLKPNGRYVVAGAIGGAMVELDVRTLYLKDLRLLGCTELADEVFPNLIKLIESEKIRPLVAHVFPLAEIVAAQKLFLQKQFVG